MHIIKNLLRIPLQAVRQRLNLQRDDLGNASNVS